MGHVVFANRSFRPPSKLCEYPLAWPPEQHSLNEWGKTPRCEPSKVNLLQIYLVTENINFQRTFLHSGGWAAKTKQSKTKQNKKPAKQNPVGCREENVSISISISWHLPHDGHQPPHLVCVADSHAGTQGLPRTFPSSRGWSAVGLYPSAALPGPTEKAAVGIIFSILPKPTLAKRTSGFKWVLQRTAKHGNDGVSTNTQESYRPDEIVAISHRIFFSATSWDITITRWSVAVKLANTHTHKTWK